MEVAAELHDMINEDLKKVYPDLMPFVSIKLIELQDHVLSTYDRAISDFTRQEFERCVLSRSRVPSLCRVSRVFESAARLKEKYP